MAWHLFRRPPDPHAEVKKLLKEVLKRQESIKNKLHKVMANTEEAVAALNEANATLVTAKTTLGKVATETDGLLQRIKDLEDAAGNTQLPEALVNAIAAVKLSAEGVRDAATSVDIKVPDVAPPA